MLPVMGRPPAAMVALNPEHTGCGHGSGTLYAFLNPLSRIGVRPSTFPRDRYAGGEMEGGKMSIPRCTGTLPLGPGNVILIAQAWEILTMRIIYRICGDNWPWFLWVHSFKVSRFVFVITSAPYRLQCDGFSLVKSATADCLDGDNTKLTEAMVDTRRTMSNNASGVTYYDNEI